MVVKPRLAAVILSILSASVLQAGNYNFSWSAADLVATINGAGGAVCLTSACNYDFVAARPVWTIAPSSYTLSNQSDVGGASWSESIVVAPPPAGFGDGNQVAIWQRTGAADPFLHELPSGTPFSLTVTADIAPMNLEFLFSGLTGDPAKPRVQATLAPVPEPGSYAALLMLGVAAIGYRSKFRK
jgi:hypothetical protein